MTSQLTLAQRWKSILASQNLKDAVALLEETPKDHVLPGGAGLLFHAVLREWTYLVRLLLKKGWNPLPDAKKSQSPLVLAAGTLGNAEITRILFHTARRNLKDSGQYQSSLLEPVLAAALKHENKDIFDFLQAWLEKDSVWILENSGNIDTVGWISENPTEKTPIPGKKLFQALKKAAKANNPELMAAIHQAGGPFVWEGKHAISAAIDSPDAFRWLVSHGAHHACPKLLNSIFEQRHFLPWHRIESLECLLDSGTDFLTQGSNPENYPGRFLKSRLHFLFEKAFEGKTKDQTGKTHRSRDFLLPRILNHPNVKEAAKDGLLWHWMASGKSSKMAWEVLHGLDSPAISALCSFGRTPLHWLCQNVEGRAYGEEKEPWQEMEHLVEFFLTHGVDPDIRDAQGKTALDVAMHWRNPGMAITLLKAQPDPEKMETLFRLASSQSSFYRSYQSLLVGLTDKNDFPKLLSNNETPLHLAMSGEEIPHLPYIKSLIENGVPVNQKNHQKKTALGILLEKLHPTQVRCDVFGRCDKFYKWVEVGHFLLDNGADLGMADPATFTEEKKHRNVDLYTDLGERHPPIQAFWDRFRAEQSRKNLEKTLAGSTQKPCPNRI